ncbi:rhomboid-like protein [Mycobacterium sp. 48b]|uniref:rhomboid-like protein n=1 Tax=Mycobacterium sp. 48b TaxID=3400426 RepID=UPI003AAC992E
MFARLLSALIRVRVTLVYAAALFVIASLLLILGPKVQDRVVGHLSTNLENLRQGHLGTLVGSAFVTAEGYTYLLLPGLVCLLALAELLWCSRRLIQAFALGHVGATLIVAAGLAGAVKLGWLPLSVAHAKDVGLSYGTIAVLGTLTAAIPVLWRPAWVGGWVTIALVVAAWGTDFTAAGHAIALIIGILLSTRFGTDSDWTPARLILLAVGIAFGLLLLLGVSLPAAPIALPAGLAVAVIASWAWWRWFGVPEPSEPSLATVSA